MLRAHRIQQSPITLGITLLLGLVGVSSCKSTETSSAPLPAASHWYEVARRTTSPIRVSNRWTTSSAGSPKREGTAEEERVIKNIDGGFQEEKKAPYGRSTTTYRYEGGAILHAEREERDRIEPKQGRVEPPEVIIPKQPIIGQTWSATHIWAGEPDNRSCVIERTPFCKDGFASRCLHQSSDGPLCLRVHYCPGQWKTGYEFVIHSNEDNRTMELWSTRVVVGDREQPGVDIAKRGLPECKDLAED